MTRSPSITPTNAEFQTSKVLNYLDHMITGPFFVMFMFIWAYLRHLINLRLLYSLFPYSIPGLPFPANEFATVGSFTLDWPTQQYKCWISQIITFCLLASLQAVNIFWFFLICKIAARYLKQGEKKDDRSDEEEDLDEEVIDEKGLLVNGSAGADKVHENGHLEIKKAAAGMEVNKRNSTLRKR